jgi:phasin family protein
MQGTNDQMNKITDNLIQACSDINMAMRDSMNAVLQSASIVTKGCSDMCDSMSSIVQKSIDQSAKVSTAMMSAKSIHDVMDTQSNILKSNFDSLMSDMNNLSQISSRIAQDAATPVTNTINDTINKMSKMKVA